MYPGILTNEAQYSYYKFYTSCEDCFLEITVNSMQAGSPLLVLVNHKGAKLPTTMNYMHSGLVHGSGNVEITPDLVKQEEDINSDVSGWYYIGLYSELENQYTISV